MTRLPLLALLLLLSACSSSEPMDTPEEALTGLLLRATSEVPSFGGVEIEGDRVIVSVLGDAPEAADAVRDLFGSDTQTEVRSRPARGRGSEQLKSDVSRLLFGALQGAQSSDYDETTGYVRLGVLNAEAVRQAPGLMESAGLPTDQIIVQVEGQIVAF